ncbi:MULTISPECIES: hypothetical protein [Paenibacillus]|uniref:hypothetical protein n=1 Tax=Paenibacillus TaxID=44249 RepID=UPI00073ED175|nr:MULTISPECIES: hypothetical protein [Paenibacillus]MDU4697848.1 hypothetical protein [Paenibacillus sp.]
MIRKITALLFSMAFLSTFPFQTIVQAGDYSLVKAAAQVYNTDLKKTALHVTQDDELKEYFYDTTYIPIRDLFQGYTISLDKNQKVATVKNQDSELVLNFSGQEIKPSANQVVLSSDTVRLSKGIAEISAFAITYIFDKYGDAIEDPERDAWKEKLSFLNIETEGISGVRDGYMHVYVVYLDQSTEK